MTPSNKNQKSFIQNVVTLMTGTSLAQLISLLLVPVISRLFTPEDFGAAALFLSLGMILATGGSLRFDQAIILPDKDSVALKLFVLCIASLLASAALFLIVAIVFTYYFPDASWIKTLGVWLYVVPVQGVLLGISYCLVSLHMRAQQYKIIAASQISRYTVTPLGRIAIGLCCGSSTGGLIIGLFGGLLSAIGLMYWRLKDSFTNISRYTDITVLKATAKEYKDFPLHSTPAALVFVISENMTILLFGFLYPSSIVGYFALGYRVIQAPVGVICESVRKVFLVKASRLATQHMRLRSILIKAVLGMAAVGIIPSLVLMAYGEEIFSLLLGSKWVTAGLYAEILAPWLFTIFIAIPMTTTFIVMRKQNLWLKLQLSILFFRVVAMLSIHVLTGRPEDVLMGYVMVGIVFNIVIMVIGYKIVAPPKERTNTA
ncbi:MAG: oligosaccharide flippase family protein [Kangiella sp.]|nr:oligosaccharide flippase family protein [Kangiella sp.]